MLINRDADAGHDPTSNRWIQAWGATKLASEWVGADAARAGSLSCVMLRYFNVAGAWAGAADRPAHARRRTGTGLVLLAVSSVGEPGTGCPR
ncbi:NAD-dependent epimerase/dehydratase family protein [Phytohabitans kaempferiae]|uniref:NAD-dependent epimerase/dehydratase family protein n=1 Tax=Phytohabitans kaempferiae TaxID=1620943 RepID=A0ABV6MI62_9ACTN